MGDVPEEDVTHVIFWLVYRLYKRLGFLILIIKAEINMYTSVILEEIGGNDDDVPLAKHNRSVTKRLVWNKPSSSNHNNRTIRCLAFIQKGLRKMGILSLFRYSPIVGAFGISL